MRTIFFVVFVVLFATSADAATKETWQRDPGLAFDSTFNNLDIVQEKGKNVRAYYMKGGSIHSTLSTDNGDSFTDQGEILFGSHHALVSATGKTTRMYYTAPGSKALVSATTSNGSTFTSDSGERISNIGQVIHPSVLKNTDGTFKIFYDQEVSGQLSFGKRIRSLTCSADGLTCTRDKGARIKKRSCRKMNRRQKRRLKKRGVLCDVSLVWSPFVEYDEASSKYRLYFSVEKNRKKSGVYLAISGNGKRFNIKNKVLGVNPQAANGNGQSGMLGNPQDPFIFDKKGGTRLMYVWETDDGIYKAHLQQ